MNISCGFMNEDGCRFDSDICGLVALNYAGGVYRKNPRHPLVEQTSNIRFGDLVPI